MSIVIKGGDCVAVMREMESESVDSVVTDPPYGLEFMGKEWDKFDTKVGRGNRVEAERSTEMTPEGVGHIGSKGPYLAARVDSVRVAGQPFQEWCEEWARECLRVLKPGGHLLAFGGTRTYHRLACAIEDAGFEIRDSIHWMYGSGFPKSMDVSKAIDKAAGVRTVVGIVKGAGSSNTESLGEYQPEYEQTVPTTVEAEQWEGWGTALKPAHEPIIMARKPLIGTVAKNVLTHGTGALNIDVSRVEGTPDSPGSTPPSSVNGARSSMAGAMERVEYDATKGRWPANVILSHQEDCDDGECMEGCPVAELDAQSGTLKSGTGNFIKKSSKDQEGNTGAAYGAESRAEGTQMVSYGDAGGASRFFYQAKAPKKDRNRGLPPGEKNTHPTVKPTPLMLYLIRLVTPPGGIVLDPFLGSGTTLIAAMDGGFNAIGIERDEDYLKLARRRIGRIQIEALKKSA